MSLIVSKKLIPKLYQFSKIFLNEKGDFIAKVGQGSAMCDSYSRDEDIAGFWSKLCIVP